MNGFGRCFLRLFLVLLTGTLSSAGVPSDAQLGSLQAVQAVQDAARCTAAGCAPRDSIEKGRSPRAFLVESLRYAGALGQLWQEPLTSADVQAEMDRIVRETRDPELLRRLANALGNDGDSFAETVVFPRLAERRLRERFREEPRFQESVRSRAAEATRSRGDLGPFPPRADSEILITYRRAAREADSSPAGVVDLGEEEWRNALEALAADHDVEGRGVELDELVTRLPIGEPGSLREDETAFRVTTIVEAGPTTLRLRHARWHKIDFAAWWASVRDDVPTAMPPVSPKGYTLNLEQIEGWCADGTWSELPDAALAPRYRHRAVWTGVEWVVWGGFDGMMSLDTGARYTPVFNDWIPLPSEGGPASRSRHSMVWTGREMIVWGGSSSGNPRNDGARYDPVAGTWRALEMRGAPMARRAHSAVWTGEEMIVWGGSSLNGPLAGGGRFDPATGSWRSLEILHAPSARWSHDALWNGTEMIVWGGTDGNAFLRDGGRYDPLSGAWWPVTDIGAPELIESGWLASFAPPQATAWTGDAMAVCADSGGLYDPEFDRWSAMSPAGAPESLPGHTAVWTGEELLVWGGGREDDAHSGGRYQPDSDKWIPIDEMGGIIPYRDHVAVWAGNHMLLWGGFNGSASQSGFALCSCPRAVSAFRDVDGDGYGGADELTSCEARVPAGYSILGEDCDDRSPSIHPVGNDATCDGIDQDCSGVADDGFVQQSIHCGTLSCVGGVVVEECGFPTPAGENPVLPENCDSVAPGAQPPRPGPTLMLDQVDGVTRIEWESAPDSLGYDLVRGRVDTLRIALGGYAQSADACLLSSSRRTRYDYAVDPVPGAPFWFLARGVNCVDRGSFDSTAPSQVTGRDAGLDATPVSCATGSTSPTAFAGNDRVVLESTVVPLDGTSSSDPLGLPLTYAWRVRQAPPGSTASFSDDSSATPTFAPDVIGSYILELVVSNEFLSSPPDSVFVTAVDGTLLLDTLSPASVPVGSGDTLITVEGTGFQPGATVLLNGSPLVTTYVDPSQVTATVPSTFVIAPDILPVQVANPDGESSPALLFTISDVLTLASTLPIGAPTGSPGFRLRVSGTGFDKGAVVVLDGVDLATSFMGTRMMDAEVPGTLLDADGTLDARVRNPGGALSSAVPLQVKPLTLDAVSPLSGPIGTAVDFTGDGFDLNPSVRFSAPGGGWTAAPVVSRTATSARVQVPPGAVDGPVSIRAGGLTRIGPAFTVPTSKTYDLAAVPSTAMLFPGETVRFAIKASSPDGYVQAVDLSVSELPAGITATLEPPRVAMGQNAYLTLEAAEDQPAGPIPMTVTGVSEFEGQALVETVNLTADVHPVSSSFIGQCVSAEFERNPLAGVVITFLGLSPGGIPNGCSVPSDVSDGAGNFVFMNLPPECAGPQLIRFDANNVTNRPGEVYSSVDKQFTIVEGEVSPAPSFVHLIRIDDAEVVLIPQNQPVTQTFTFQTIPNLRIEVYPGTEIFLADGTPGPDPFPLIAVRVPVDRLPGQMDLQEDEIMPFLVAFQPAASFASKPVAVDYPNLTGAPESSVVDLLTLDPTLGVMVQYGTATVSGDGRQLVADANPARPGERYGITHFDWHGPLAAPPSDDRGGCVGACCGSRSGAGVAGGAPGGGAGLSTRGVSSIEYLTGYEEFSVVDASIDGIPLPVAFVRTYRGSPTFRDFLQGGFGRGTTHNFAYFIDAAEDSGAEIIRMITPLGRRLPLERQEDGTYRSSGQQDTAGGVLRWDEERSAYLYESVDGSVMFFQTADFVNSILTRIEDRRGNFVNITTNGPPGNLVSITASNGQQLLFVYDGIGVNAKIVRIRAPGGRTTEYEYDPSSRLSAVRDPLGNVTRYTYDGQNRLTSVIDARGVTVVTKEYNAWDGRASREVFPDGSEVRYKFIPSRCPSLSAYTQTIFVSGVPQPCKTNVGSDIIKETYVEFTYPGDPEPREWLYRFDTQGRLTDVTDPLGGTVSYEYDVNTGRTSAVRGSAGCETCGGASVGDESYEWDSMGRLTKRIDALGSETLYTYGAMGEDPLTVTDALMRTTTFVKNSLGEVIEIRDQANNPFLFLRNARGQLVRATDPTSRTTALAYGGDHRLRETSNSLMQTISYSYDESGNLTGVTLPDGVVLRVTYDEVDRPVAFVDAAGETTRFAYDAVGNLTSLTDAAGNVTRWEYDGSSRLVREISPLLEERIYTYDRRGDLAKYTDRNGRVHSFSYTRRGLIKSATFADGSTVAFDYDSANRLRTLDDAAGGVLEFEYDLLSRLSRVASRRGVLSYEYDAIDRRVRRLNGSLETSYRYNSQGLIDRIMSDGLQVDLSYDGAGRLQEAVLPNGITVTHSHDAGGRLIRQEYATPTATFGRDYSYDRRGNVTAVSGSAFVPREASQVIEIDSGNRIGSRNGQLFAYDAEGRRLTDGARNFEWDDRGRLLAVRTVNGSQIYTYDGLNRREVVDDANGRAFYLWDVLDVASISRAGPDEVRFLRGLGLDQTYAEAQGSGVTTYFMDRVGTVFGGFDSAGEIREYAIDEFGLGDAPDERVFFPYAGREQDSNGLYYLRARYYDPRTGVFLTEDPIQFAGGSWNLYVYAGGNPVRYRDPTGLFHRPGSGGGLGGGNPFPFDYAYSPFDPIEYFKEWLFPSEEEPEYRAPRPCRRDDEVCKYYHRKLAQDFANEVGDRAISQCTPSNPTGEARRPNEARLEPGPR